MIVNFIVLALAAYAAEQQPLELRVSPVGTTFVLVWTQPRPRHLRTIWRTWGTYPGRIIVTVVFITVAGILTNALVLRLRKMLTRFWICCRARRTRRRRSSCKPPSAS
jgi:hypothetical protein